MAMTAAERQRKRRAKLKQNSMKPILVRGTNGEFDERIRIALAVKDLAANGELPPNVIEKIIARSETVFPCNDVATQKFIRKIVSDYLE